MNRQIRLLSSAAFLLAAIYCNSVLSTASASDGEAPRPDGDKALAKPGFVVQLEDGRLWVFHEGSEELKKFHEHGELAKHVILPGRGPGGKTLKSPDKDTALEYLHTWPGFTVKIEDGRLWVFREGSEELKKFLEHGELAKHVILPARGPDGMTLKGPDRETLDSYLALISAR